MTTKIRIVIRSFDHPNKENRLLGLERDTRKIGLPDSRVFYTVLRSPHIDKKSREQFEMEIKKVVIKTETHELRKKFFRLKRQRIFGAQYEIRFSCKTRSDKGKLQR
nr:ribosomal protein S10 [Ceratophyllum demersum]